MTVDSIKTENFRNIESMELIPEKGVNVIYGENAQGKTNILESIWLFTGCKSFRSAKDAELMKFGAELTKLEMLFDDGVREKKAAISIGKNKKKAFLNGVELEGTSELIGQFYSVIFSPAHLSLIQDGPAFRRKFIDTALCELKPKYSEYLANYKRALIQRNALLKDLYMNADLYDMLDSWDDLLARYSAAVIAERLAYIKTLSGYCEEIYSGISENKEKISVLYSRSNEINDGMLLNDIYAYELENLKNARKQDVILKTTSVGPHRDDIDIKINGISARSYGSQGQQRSCALALKLAESEIIKNTTGQMPVTLLDDVMSELDEKRQDYVLNHITDRQVFLTCCDPSQVLRMCGGKSFLIKEGKIV